MIERHLMHLRARDDIGAEEEAAIRGGITDLRTCPADTTLIQPGREISCSTLLLDGIACRYKDLSQGQRQITELHVAGDFMDLHSFTLKYLDHAVMTLTPCTIASFPHEKLSAVTEQFPHLTRVYWFATNLDAAVHREWEVSLGRRTAKARVAHLFCELHVRLGIVGLIERDGYDFPLTQSDLAECLGLTPVHINRMLKELRDEGLAEFQRGRVQIRDLQALRRVAEFDPAYLYLEKRPR